MALVRLIRSQIELKKREKMQVREAFQKFLGESSLVVKVLHLNWNYTVSNSIRLSRELIDPTLLRGSR